MKMRRLAKKTRRTITTAWAGIIMMILRQIRHRVKDME